MKINASEFQTRSELEHYINREVSVSDDYIVSGGKEDMKRLGLSRNTNIYGVKCEVTDEKQVKKPVINTKLLRYGKTQNSKKR